MDCYMCGEYVSASGECNCDELLQSEVQINFHQRQFFHVIRTCSRYGVPNPPQEAPLSSYPIFTCGNDPHEMIGNMIIFSNGVSIYLNTNWNEEIHADAQYELTTIESRIRGIRLSRGIFNRNYSIPIRIRCFVRETGMWNAVIDIVGERLNWQQILDDIESNVASISLHVYVYRNEFEDNLSPTPATEVKMEAGTDTFCCICQDKTAEGESTTQMLCKHEFHTKCINKWFASSNCCPLCRDEAARG